MRFAVLSVYLQPYLSIRTMRTFILFLLAAVTFFHAVSRQDKKAENIRVHAPKRIWTFR